MIFQTTKKYIIYVLCISFQRPENTVNLQLFIEKI